MRRYAIWMVAVGAAFLGSSCGGDSPTVTPTPAPPTTTLASQPSPSPSATASPVAQQCTFAPGPVVRFAISPRELRTDGEQINILVRARPDWDEVVCIDKDKIHRIDFNANQRNANDRESCYEGTVSWTTVSDDDQMITSQSSRHPDNFIWRYNIEPRGRTGTIAIEARLDGLTSYPWQSGAGYRREPFRIVAMGANEMARDCTCIYHGNGVYEGGHCPKLNPAN
jgi:hypothetical protein